MPSQLEIEFRAAGGGATQNEKLAAYFKTFPDQWLPMPQLAQAINAYAVHSRVSDLRSGHGKFKMTIMQKNEGRGRSFYKYIPDAP